MRVKLDHHHRHTVDRVFAHPIGHNIKWRDVICLLERFGEVYESHRGAYAVTYSDKTVSLGRARGRDLSEDQVMRVRHVLVDVGLSPTKAQRAA